MTQHMPLGVLIVLLFASPSWAQSEPVAHTWSHSTTLTMSGGVGTASDHNGALFGGAMGWEITPRVAVEGSGTWFDKQAGATAFSAGLSVRAALTESHPTAPFVEGGFGLYLASFDPNRSTDIPAFYRNRMSGNHTNWFTDPAFFAAAGLDLFRSNRLAVRPTVGAVIAVRDARAYIAGTLAVRAEYHFGDLPPSSSR